MRELELLREYELHHLMRTRRIERDALFLERCIELLKPGGRLAIVLPENKLGSEMWTHLRKWLISKTRVLAVVSLPRAVFMPHTSQKTSILFAQKRSNRDKPDMAEKTFFAISERGGKDSRGVPIYRPSLKDNGAAAWSTLDHDFENILKAYQTCKL